MKIFLLLSIIILAICISIRKFLYSAKRNLFRDQTVWSNKDINIKYSNSNEIQKSNRNNNYLKTIADESKLYLEDHSREEAE